MADAAAPLFDPRHHPEDELAAAVERILALLGDDPSREGLQRTPQRVAETLRFLTSGHEQDVAAVVKGAVFVESYDEMVVVKDIELYSMCEHHLLPFYGKCHVAYLPQGRIVGLSKLPRVVDVFARRLQVQERLTTQIAEAIDEVLEPIGVAVVIEAVHLCMMMRGIQKQNSQTVTSCMLGGFRHNDKSRAEFLELIRRR
jgi:GTP cyclohydrolase IA